MEEVNNNLYQCAMHLSEASLYMSNIEEMKPFAVQLAGMADGILKIIEIPKQKVSEERITELLSEILGSKIENE